PFAPSCKGRERSSRKPGLTRKPAKKVALGRNATGRFAANAHRGSVQTNERRLIFVAETVKNIHRSHIRLSRRLTVGDKNVDPLLEGLSPAHLATTKVVASAGGKNCQPRFGVDLRGNFLQEFIEFKKALGSLA